ncbi:YceI family protein [Phenylobacterium terrae]|uniref:YceI family protein n=1 Tax=Phenylobacterium terrae TaxID=2665495 RepID=A0ABW4N1V1_9CAUL
MSDVAENPARAGSGRYATIAIVLHWTIAALILTQIVLAGRMEDRGPEAFAVTQLHKSVGVTILLLSLVRLGWRLMNPPPPMPDTLRRWEKTLAGFTHAAFYVVMIGMPLTGWIMVSTSRIEIPTLLYGVIPWPDLPGTDAMSRDAREGLHEFGEAGHDLIIKGFYGLIALHVAGALKHQLLSRDEPVLARMAPGARAGRWLEPRLAIIALAAAAVAAFAAVVTPPLGGLRPPAAAPAEDAEPLEATGPGEPLAADSGAVAPAEPETPAAAGEPIAWRLDDGSKIEFETAWGQTKIEGEFERFSADIRFSPDALDRSRVSVTIDVASVDTGDPQRDEALPGFDFFNIDEHPRATFVADRFERTGEDRYIARGRLTLKGVTRPVSLPFELDIDEDKARVRGETSLDRTAFGVGQGEFAATDQIPADVKIEVDIRARR